MGPQIFGAAGSSGSGGGSGVAWDNQEPIVTKKDLEIVNYEVNEFDQVEINLTADQIRNTLIFNNTGTGYVEDEFTNGLIVRMPSPAAMEAEFPEIAVGESIIFEIHVRTPQGSGLITQTGMYRIGNNIIPANGSATFRIFRRANMMELFEDPNEAWVMLRTS
jgi:hypothetical protein